MERIHTRIATLGDVPEVAALFDAYRQFYDQAPAPALAEAFLQDRLRNDESVILLACAGAVRVVGFCQLYPTFCSVAAKPIFSLYDLFVAPAARRCGAGRLLLQAAEQLARERGMARLDLTTARTNLAAQAAYESLGWVRDELFHSYSLSIQPEPPAPQPVRAKQSIGLVCLVVPDYDAAIAFYVGVLGFTLVEDTFIPAQSKRWVVVAPPGATETRLLLARAADAEQASRVGNQTGGRVFLFLSTDDIDRDHRNYRSRGVVFVREPAPQPYGTVAVFRDPWGNLWDLLQPSSVAAAR